MCVSQNLPLVEANSVRKDLHSRVGGGVIVWLAIFGADIVRASHRLVSSQGDISKVDALVGHVERESSGVEVRNKGRHIELALTSHDVDRDSHVGADLGRRGQAAKCKGTDKELH